MIRHYQDPLGWSFVVINVTHYSWPGWFIGIDLIDPNSFSTSIQHFLLMHLLYMASRLDFCLIKLTHPVLQSHKPASSFLKVFSLNIFVFSILKWPSKLPSLFCELCYVSKVGSNINSFGKPSPTFLGKINHLFLCFCFTGVNLFFFP